MIRKIILTLFFLLMCTPILADTVVVSKNTTVNFVFSFDDDVVIKGKVLNDVIAFFGDIIIEKGGIVSGNAIAINGIIDLDNGGFIGGRPLPIEEIEELFQTHFWQSLETHLEEVRWIKVVGVFGFIVGAFFLAIFLSITFFIVCLIALAASDYVKSLAALVNKKPLRMLGVGFITTLIAVATGVLLCISIIGIPLAILLGIMSFFVSIIGVTGMSYLVGAYLIKVTSKNNNPMALFAVFLGFVVLFLLGLIPLFGQLRFLIIKVMGVGAVIQSMID